MIFVNTKERADELHSYLVSNGLKVAKIHGDIPPRERKRTMKSNQKTVIRIHCGDRFGSAWD